MATENKMAVNLTWISIIAISFKLHNQLQTTQDVGKKQDGGQKQDGDRKQDGGQLSIKLSYCPIL